MPADRATFLIVSDDPADRAALLATVERGEHRFFEASAAEAVAQATEHQPCAVLIDARLAAADRCRLLDEIGHRVSDDYLSFIALSEPGDEALLDACARCGTEDFILRPYSVALVRTKLSSLVRARKLHRRLEEQRQALKYHQSVLQRDYKIAEKIFSNLAGQRRFEATNIGYFLSPMSGASGDLVFVAQKPNGDQRIMLGDFTGHGLAAAVGVLPVSETFHSMTNMGFPIGDMVTVMNRKLKELLPTGLFLACAVIEFNPHKMTLSLWNGGLPEVLLRRADGRVERLPAEHFPLAVVDSKLLGKELKVLEVGQGDRLYLYSDGLTEARAPDGALFGEERLVHLVQTRGGRERLAEAIGGILAAFRGPAPQSDDISLIELLCDAQSEEEGYSVRQAG